MALIIKDRVKVTSGSTGTGTFTLGAAVLGFQDFVAIGDGNTTYYTIALQSGTEWEVGVGTVTDTGGGVYTLSRDTVLESSNAGSKVNFSAGTKDVFVTYPAERAVYLNAAGSAVDVLDINTVGAGTANITTANITAGVVTTTPVNSTDIVNKQYVDDLVVSGVHFHTPVRVETTGNLNATYNNGASGVGATLTNAGTQVALVIDGVTVNVNDRVLVYLQTNQTQNGIYVVSNTGSGSTNWVLTRATDADSYGLASPNELGEGSAVFVQQGDTGAGETYICNTAGVITFGTTNITFAQISSAQIYTAGTGLTLTNTTFSITNTGTAGTYGSASQVPVFVTNAQGQVTSVTNTNIAISSSAVSGLAASATTDTTNAANITSGTLNTARLNGSYTGITGVGTLTAGTWNATTIAPNYGGTGITSYTTGDLLYADGTTSLAKLAGVATGNALLSGGVGTAPAWGKVGLTTHVSGTLPIGNGGTGQTTASAAINALLPAQTSQTGRYLTTNGTDISWAAVPAPNAEAVYGLFRKADPTIVAFTKTGAFTVSTATTIYVEVNGNLKTIASSTAVMMPGSATTGTDYAIWAKTDGTLEATTNHTSPPSANARKIGGFHYAAGGNATGTSGGNSTPAINAYSFWDLKFKPSCADPRGMTLVAGAFWVDIYLTGVDAITNGSSKYNVTMADGSSPPKVPTMFGGNGSTTYGSYTWFEAMELATAFGKRCPTQQEFMSAAYGTTEASSIGTDQVSTILNAAYTSKWGVIQATGVLWVWGRDRGGPFAGASWNANTEGRGSEYNAPNAARFGGRWDTGADSGSRCSDWRNAASTSHNDIGSRFVCSHYQADL